MPISSYKTSGNKSGKGKQRMGTVASVNRTRIEDIQQFDDDDDLGQSIEDHSRPGPSRSEVSTIKSVGSRKELPEVISIDSEEDCDTHNEPIVAVNPLHEQLLRKRKEVWPCALSLFS